MERRMTADQLLPALWRRKAVVGLLLSGTFAVGAGLVLAQPSIYEASVLVRVEPQRPSEEMVQRTVSDLVERRLLTIRQELLARPVLQKAIEELKLYPEVVRKRGIEAAVARMRGDITVSVEGESAFQLTYASRDPQIAAAVANRLPQLFADEALRVRQMQAAYATQLFDEELERLKKAVSEWERKIARFKVDHMGELPEQLEVNMRSLDRLAELMQTKSEELRVAEGRRSELVRMRHPVESEAGRLKSAEDGLTRALVAARTTWTADHPEVQRLEKELEAVREKREEAEGRLWAERAERARAAQLVAAIREEIAGLEQQAEALSKRIERTPQWAHELSVLQRDYEITRTKYQSVVSRKVEAVIAQELEAKGAKTMFNVISPAGVPTEPARPDRMGGLIIALVVALAISALGGVLLELRDDSVRDIDDAQRELAMPVLAVVPQLDGLKTERRVLTPHTAS